MTIYCPGWLPSPIDGVIHGQWNTARVPDKQWQLGYAWLEQGELVHVVFEGYPPGTFPPDVRGQPCFAGREPATEQVGGQTVTWYDHNLASHTGHIAAIFHAGRQRLRDLDPRGLPGLDARPTRSRTCATSSGHSSRCSPGG